MFTQETIDYLKEQFPLRLPTLTETDREIGVLIGQQSVIEFMTRRLDEIKEEALAASITVKE